MNFSDVKSVTIPEGVVTEIKQGDTVLWKAKTKRLPDEYQEVEWIKPLNAKLSLPADTMDYGYASFKVSFPNEQPSTYKMGRAGTSNTTKNEFEFATAQVGDTFRVIFELIDTDSFGVKETYQVWDTFDPSNSFVARWDGDNLYLASKTAPASSYFTSERWYLFGNNEIAYDYGGKLTVYEVSLGQFTFVPCYRKSDNVVGMAAIVRTSGNFNSFLTSAEGSFEKGGDV